MSVNFLMEMQQGQHVPRKQAPGAHTAFYITAMGFAYGAIGAVCWHRRLCLQPGITLKPLAPAARCVLHGAIYRSFVRAVFSLLSLWAGSDRTLVSRSVRKAKKASAGALAI